LFADDSIVYRVIRSFEDHVILQQDLNKLASWSETWLMKFNIAKCASLTITRKRKPSVFQYTIFGQDLAQVDDHEYLGVTISKDLRWSKHCNKVCQKSYRTLGLLRRTLSPCTQEVKAKAFKALVKPQLEYACEAWNPSTVGDINRLEQVQRQGARFVQADYRRTSSVTAMLQNLHWDPLHIHRLFLQTCLFYKLHYKLVNLDYPSNIKQASDQYTLRNDHQFKYVVPLNSLNCYRFAFYPRTVRIWNNLSPSTVMIPTISAFKAAVYPELLAMTPPPGERVL